MAQRLDYELVRRGLAQSRERAKEYIGRGIVEVNGAAADKPSLSVSENDEIAINGQTLKYVGRGGLKLEGALKTFKIDVRGKICLDIGASTGGFTDCLLQSGASKVYAVDVGHGQLAEKLLNDPRVVSREGVNVKDFTPDMLPERPDFVCADLSFISCKFAASAAAEILAAGCEAVLLIKPQFETGRQHISKGGIVKDKKVHAKIIEELCGFFSSLNFEVKGVIPSPIKGGDGNAEYLAYLVKHDSFTPSFIDAYGVCGITR